MSPELALAAAIAASLAAYLLGGGADFGGGVWDLLATGPRAERQRAVIAHAIGPVWEANHVWLIVAIVLLFVGFPAAFAALGTALHVPLTLVLFGIVLRGSAFAFRAYGPPDAAWRARWGAVFSVASTVTPFMLGVCAGAIAAGGIPADPVTGRVGTDFVASWLRPFPFAIGALTLALCAYLAAVYLTLETDDPALRADFRLRALVAAAVVGALAALALAVAAVDAPRVRDALAPSGRSLAFHLVTGAAALATFAALARRQFALARALAAAHVTLVLAGWAIAQFPYVVPPDLTIANAAAPAPVLRTTLIVLGCGAILLLPSLVVLFRVFKSGRPPAALAAPVVALALAAPGFPLL